MAVDFASPKLDTALYGCRVGRTTNQTGITTTETAVSFQSGAVDFDPQGMWNAGTPDRITIQKSGVYFIVGNLCWTSNTTGTYRIAYMRVNGSESQIISGKTMLPGNPYYFTRAMVCAIVNLGASSYVELMGRHNASSNLEYQVDGVSSMYLSAVMLGEI